MSKLYRMNMASANRIGNLRADSYTRPMPEKSFNEVARVERELYEKGLAAVERNNLDYALVIFTQILAKEPAFYDCREKLRGVQLKKAGSGGGFFKKVLGAAGSSPALARAQVLLRSNPMEAIRSLEEVLNGDPKNVLAHKTLAEAALASDLPRTAVLSLEIARTYAPKDQDVALRLAEALVVQGNVPRAMTIYKELQAATTRSRAGTLLIGTFLKIKRRPFPSNKLREWKNPKTLRNGSSRNTRNDWERSRKISG
jgi:tetratricopeptide (TPR) repeat protein